MGRKDSQVWTWDGVRLYDGVGLLLAVDLPPGLAESICNAHNRDLELLDV